MAVLEQPAVMMSPVDRWLHSSSRGIPNGGLYLKAMGCLPLKVATTDLLLVVTRERPHGTVQSRKTSRFSEPYWKAAQDIVPVHMITKSAYQGDYLVLPKTKPYMNQTAIDLARYTNTHGARTALAKGKPLSFPIDSVSAWLLGAYVAEGWCGGSNSAYVAFSTGLRENEFRAKIRNAIRHIGYSPVDKKARGDGSITMFFTSNILRRAVPNWCGHGAKNKHVPDFIFWHNNEQIVQSFLDGYFAGDGYLLRPNRIYGHPYAVNAASTVSKCLVLQIQMLLARLGHFARIYTKQQRSRVIKGYPAKGGTIHDLRYASVKRKTDQAIEIPYGFITPIRIN